MNLSASDCDMKIKQRPEDFQVEERTDLVPGDSGLFALYRLEKQGWTTPDAVQVIQRRWRVDRRRISYGGLKDRHAATSQFLTIERGPRRNLTHQRLRLRYLGQAVEPFTSALLTGNRFRITVRDLSAELLENAAMALAEVACDGVPNYFDDQRFGCVGPSGDFMARALVQGKHEDALKLALTLPYEFDRAAHKRDKAILRKHWGAWARCGNLLRDAGAVIAHLRHNPHDFAGALERFRPELRGLHLSAYQSYLWNRLLASWLRGFLRTEQAVPIRLRQGDVPFHRALDVAQREELARLSLPLPSAQVALADDSPIKPLLDGILTEEGIRLEDFRLKGFRDLFFSRGNRAGLCLPENLSHESGVDELRKKRRKLILAFDLPPGSYATLIVKRIARSMPAEAHTMTPLRD